MTKRKRSLLDAITQSQIFLALATENYLEEIKDPKSEIAIQVAIAKKYNKPTIILIDTRLSEEKKIDLDRYFIDLNVIGVIEVNLRDSKAMNNAVKEVVEIMKKHGIKMMDDNSDI